MSAIAKPGSTDWEIRSRADACLLTGRKFEDMEPFYSRLVPSPEGYVREDYAEESWSDELKDGAISSWKTVYRAPPPPKAEPVKKEDIETILRDMMAKNDPALVHAVFVLAVLLEKKRILIEKDVLPQPDGKKLRIYEHKLTGEAFIITDPDVQLTQIKDVQDRIIEVLGWGPPAPPESAEPTDSPEEVQNISSDNTDNR